MPGANSSFSLCSFTIVNGTLVGIASVSISLVFLISTETFRMFLKTMRRKKQTQKFYWPEKIISKGLVDSDISHDEVTVVINKEKNNYVRLKKSIRAKVDQLGGSEWNRLVEHG